MTDDECRATLPHVVQRRAVLAPRSPAVYYHADTISYQELWDEACAVARGLLNLGVRPGERVGLLFGNSPRWLASALGTLAVGAECVPLNTWYKRDEIRWTLKHSGVSVLLSMDRFLGRDFAAMVADAIPELRKPSDAQLRADGLPELRAAVFTGRGPAGSLSWADFLGGGRLVDTSTLGQALDRVQESAVAFVLYTSGSTAGPKGVQLVHRGIVESGHHIGQRRQIGSDDRVWLGSPLFYALAATNALPVALVHGASLVLHDHFEPGVALDDIERTRATVFYGTGNMVQAMLDHGSFSRDRVASLDKGNAGTMARYKRLTLIEFGIEHATPAYGLTESYGHATGGWPDDPLETKLTTDGSLLPGFEMAVVDPETGAPVRRGEPGRVLLRGRLTPGYLAESQLPDAVAGEGWFDTGDLGILRESGEFVFKARLKDVIKSGGIGVSPLEVEHLLTAHPDVRDAHVLGIPDDRAGELIVAFVESAGEVTADALMASVKSRAASFKVPHHIFVRRADQIPRLASGKVAKLQLAEEATRTLRADG